MAGSQNSQKENNSLIKYLAALGLFLLSKGKGILTVLKFSKFGGAAISMLVTIWAYAILFPFGFAVGLVVMILIHELGHVIAAKQKGLPVSAPLFIPFMGALITMKKHPRDAVTEAYIAIGGPVLGTVGALGAFVLGVMWQNELLIIIANAGFFINLLNLLPIHPLDGGRISTAVSRWLWVVGLIGGLVVIIYLRSPLFFIIWAMFAWDLYNKYVRHRGEHNKVHVITTELEVPISYVVEQGYFIPEEDHRRTLSFRTYSTLDQEQKLDIVWEAIGLNQTVRLPLQCKIHGVKVDRIHKYPEDDPTKLVLYCQIELEKFDPEETKYYEVPTAMRWNFGIAYGGLALLLFYMLQVIANLDWVQ